MKTKGNDTKAACDGSGITRDLSVVAGYRVLKLMFPSFKGIRGKIPPVLDGDLLERNLTENSSCHYLFFKIHAGRKSDMRLPVGRTVFVVNIPVGATSDFLGGIFSEIGEIDGVIWRNRDESRSYIALDEAVSVSGSSGYLVFKNKFEASRVYSSSSYEHTISSDTKHLTSTGLKSWICAYEASFPSPSYLLESISRYMAMFDEKEKEVEEELRRKTVAPDEEGFLVVPTKKATKKIKLTEEEGQRQKKKEVSDFYKFQVREQKIEKYLDLSEKFKRDKQRVVELKAKNHFNIH